MTISEYLTAGADISAILTGIVAVWAWTFFQWQRHKKKKLLVAHLRAERGHNGGMRTILHITAHTGLTEAEILEASNRSRLIKRYAQMDTEGKQTIKVLFGYNPEYA